MSIQHLRARQNGLSIVELMVALLLASILTLGLVYVFVTNSDTFRLNQAQARVQEAGRTASDILSRAVRNADHWGCSSPGGGGGGRLTSLLNDDSGFDSSSFFSGLAGESDVGEGSEFDAVSGSDVVIFGGLESNASLRVDQRIPVNAARLFMEDPTDLFEVGDIIVVSDCKGAEMMQATNVNEQGIVANTGARDPGNRTKNQSEYQPGATAARPGRSSFYVREGDDGDRALVYNPMRVDDRDDNEGEWAGFVELVSNVWDLRVEFGRDTSGNSRVDTWSAPGPQSEADEAIAVRFSILVRSPQEEVVEEPVSYCFPGWLDCENDNTLRTQAADERLYRVYTSTATLRNRMGQ